jgi:hypothetical protein
MKWHKGPPPSVGWWPASSNRNPQVIRWWNGKWWGVCCLSFFTAKEAARRAMSLSIHQDKIEWTDRPADWPERSRT